jgi:hypothetical protein
MAAQLAVAFAHQLPVLLFSLEDDVVDASNRVIANLGRVSVGGLRSGFRTGTVPQDAYRATERLANLPFHTDDDTGNVVEFGYRMAKWTNEHCDKSQHLRGVVIVDQLSRLLPIYRVTEREAKVLAANDLP